MRRLSAVVSAALVLTLTGSAALGDGLLYQLPEDGTWARFELVITGDNDGVRKESLVMRSVGRAPDADGSRWLELTVPREEGTRTLKLLISERRLKEGEAPLDHVVRAWVRTDNGVESLASPRDFWLLLLLAGPLADVELLERMKLDGPLGELECPGVVGRARVTEDDGHEEDLTYTIRRHDQAPFGVVTCAIDCVVRKDGRTKGKSRFELQLVEVGRNAQTLLPGYE